MGEVYTNLGTILMRREAFSPLFFYLNYEKLPQKIKEIEGKTFPEYEKALESLHEANEILLKVGKPTPERANVLFNIGEYYMIKQDWATAKEKLNESMRIAEEELTRIKPELEKLSDPQS